MGRTDKRAKRPVTRRLRLLVVRCARGAVFRHTVPHPTAQCSTTTPTIAKLNQQGE